MKIIIIILNLLTANNVIGQTDFNGKYVGYERISPYVHIDGNIRYYKYGNKNKEEWFHQVVIRIKDTLVTIEKKPVFFAKGKMNYSLSDGGFYYYHGTLLNYHNGKSVVALMDSCSYCPKDFAAFLPLASKLDTAIKVNNLISGDFTFETVKPFNPMQALAERYSFKIIKEGLMVENGFNSKILFKRME